MPELQRTLDRWEEQVRKYAYSEERTGRDRCLHDHLRVQTVIDRVVIAEFEAKHGLEGVGETMDGEADEEVGKVFA